MPSLSPPQIAFMIVGALSVVGLVVFLFRHRSTFSGYEEFEADARSVARAMGGELFRDGDDLVMSGNYGKLPAMVRFSNSDNTPGLNIRVQAPASFTLSVTPAGAANAAEGGRVVVRTNDPQFDARFTVRSNQPTEARIFLAPRTTLLLKRLCCSTKTQLGVVPGAVELSEVVIPPTGAARHIIEHLKQINALVENLREMPGAEKINILPFRRERHLAVRIVIAAGVAGALVTVFTATGVPGRPQASGAPASPAGIPPVDAVAIREVDKWRLAEAGDFDSMSQAWLRRNGVEPAGRIPGDFSGRGYAGDVAYLLLGPDGTRRVVLLSQGVARYDAQFPSFGGMALLPKENVGSVDWVGGKAPAPVDGDGLVLVRNGGDGASALALFLRGGSVVFGSPVNFDNIELR